MRKLFILFCMSLSFAGVFAGCGSGNSSDNDSQAQQAARNQARGAAPIDCQDDTCDANQQYCLVTKLNDVVLTHSCVAIPADCNDCACVVADAPKQFPTSNNCSSGTWLNCQKDEQNGAHPQFKMTCSRSG